MEQGSQWEKAYTHGGDVYRNEKIRMDFSININPLGMPDFIKQAAMDGVEESARYPDSRCRRLRRLAAGFYGVQEETLVFGNGAAELIFGIVRAVSPRRAVLTAPSFTEYEAALSSVGAEVLFFPLKEEEDFSLPADRYLDFLKSARPDMIFLCNPANPTRKADSREEEICRILEFCTVQGILAVVDECFLDLAEEDERDSVLDLVRAGEKKVFLLKAFTKSFAMAGLRLGYGFLADGELRLKDAEPEPALERVHTGPGGRMRGLWSRAGALHPGSPEAHKPGAGIFKGRPAKAGLLCISLGGQFPFI